MIIYAKKTTVKCHLCYKRFSSKVALTRHINQYHSVHKRYKCRFCQKDFLRENNKFLHERNCERRPDYLSEPTEATESTTQAGGSRTVDESEPPTLTQSTLKHTAEKYQKKFNRENKSNLYMRFNHAVREFKDILSDKTKSKAIKWYLSLGVEFCSATNPSKMTDPPVIFRSQTFASLDENDLEELLITAYDQIIDDIENFQRNGSGWILDNLVTLDLGEIFNLSI